MKHADNSYDKNMHPEDKLVVFKLSDMKYPIAGRLREFENKGRWTDSNYVYIHRGDGTILQKYSYGYEILQEINLTESKQDDTVKLSNILSVFESIQKSIFSYATLYSYSYDELAPKFIELMKEIKGNNGSYEALVGNSCSTSDLLDGAYWHYMNHNKGKSSDSYLALSAISALHTPSAACPPYSEDQDAMSNNELCYFYLNQM
jgi:hypothetical protein